MFKLKDQKLLKNFSSSQNQSTGFQNPADDYISPFLDLNKKLIEHPAATYFFRAGNNDFKKLGIFQGDILVIDRLKKPVVGDIVLVENKEALELMEFRELKKNIDPIIVWGVIRFSIHEHIVRLK